MVSSSNGTGVLDKKLIDKPSMTVDNLTAPPANTPRIEIDRVAVETMLVPIIGTSPLLMHNFGEKSKRAMLDAQQGRRKVKENRDPEAEYQGSFYHIHDDERGMLYGFPVTAFKAATISAARYYGKDVSMTSLRQFLFMYGRMTKADPQQLVEIIGTPQMREDVVRLSGPSRSADLRYRAVFNEWSTTLRVTFVTSAISQQSVLSLIEAGGLGVGVGEWRAEKRGEMGAYMVDQDREVVIVR